TPRRYAADHRLLDERLRAGHGDRRQEPGPAADYRARGGAGSKRGRPRVYAVRHSGSLRRRRQPGTDAHIPGIISGTSIIMKLVIQPPVEPERLARITAAAGSMAVVNAADEAQALAQMPGADAFFGKITPGLLGAAKKLRWVQAPTASLEHYMFP